MDLHREIDRLIEAIESGRYHGYALRLLRWRKEQLERLV